MKVLIEFHRGARCAHSDARQCAPCWKREMGAFLGETEEEFLLHWASRLAPGPDETPESCSVYLSVGFDAPADADLAKVAR
jgi:hypothetical protein